MCSATCPTGKRESGRGGADAQGDPCPGEPESRKTAQAKATEVVARLKEMKLQTAAELVEQKRDDDLLRLPLNPLGTVAVE